MREINLAPLRFSGLVFALPLADMKDNLKMGH